MFVIQARDLVQYLDLDAFIRLQTNGQFVLRQLLVRIAEQVQRWVLEVDHHFRALGRQALTGSQVKRHAGPLPVVDINADRDEGFGVAAFVRPFLFQVTRNLFALHKTGSILATHRGFAHIGLIDTTQ
ncbi:hypothetical protein D3C73_1104050 [compost metagenome]